MKYRLACLTVALISLCDTFLPAAASAQDITIQGKIFYKDGKPWLPKGIDVEAFQRPAVIPSAPNWMNDPAHLQAWKWWTEEERAAMKAKFGATVLRITVSQPALDPQSAIFDPKYLEELLCAFKQAREAGFAVIASMDAQGENGVPNLPCMPNDSTARAWKTLASHMADDAGVMFELFNEPCLWSKPDSQQAWAHEMQAAIDSVRAAGARNVLLLDGLWYGRQTKGLFALIHDPLPSRLALAVHPYLVKNTFVTEKQWNDMFGSDAGKYPMIATEWNAVDGCVGPNLPGLALSEIRYLERLNIGLIAWAIDSAHGRLVKDHEHFEPIDYQNFSGCVQDTKDHPAPLPDWGGGKLLAGYPND